MRRPTKFIKHNYITLPLPPQWEDESQVVVKGPRDGEFSPNCVCSREPRNSNETIAQFAARQLPQLRRALQSYAVVHEGETRFGDNSGFLREHSFSMDRGEIAQLQFYMISGEYVCTITFTHLLGKLNAVKPIAEQFFAHAKMDLYADRGLPSEVDA